MHAARTRQDVDIHVRLPDGVLSSAVSINTLSADLDGGERLGGHERLEHQYRLHLQLS